MIKTHLSTLKINTMNEEQETKKEWVTPEIIDLYLNTTAGGKVIGGYESSKTGDPGTVS